MIGDLLRVCTDSISNIIVTVLLYCQLLVNYYMYVFIAIFQVCMQYGIYFAVCSVSAVTGWGTIVYDYANAAILYVMTQFATYDFNTITARQLSVATIIVFHIYSAAICVGIVVLAQQQIQKPEHNHLLQDKLIQELYKKYITKRNEIMHFFNKDKDVFLKYIKDLQEKNMEHCETLSNITITNLAELENAKMLAEQVNDNDDLIRMYERRIEYGNTDWNYHTNTSLYLTFGHVTNCDGALPYKCTKYTCDCKGIVTLDKWSMQYYMNDDAYAHIYKQHVEIETQFTNDLVFLLAHRETIAANEKITK